MQCYLSFCISEVRLAVMSAAVDDRVENAIAQLPQSLQGPTAVVFERFDATSSLSIEDLAVLTRLLACSEYAGKTLTREWLWFCEALESDTIHRSKLADEIAAFREQGDTYDEDRETFERCLRQFRHRQLLAVLWRETAGHCSVAETLCDLSLVADALIQVAAEFASRDVRRRFGE